MYKSRRHFIIVKVCLKYVRHSKCHAIEIRFTRMDVLNVYCGTKCDQ